MRYQLAYADGAPSRTAVIDASEEADDVSALEVLVRRLARRICSDQELITKYALLRPARNPLFDLEYRFAQTVPTRDRLLVDWNGNCGHSILASVAAAGRWNWVSRPTPGTRTRVEVLNTGDIVVAEAVGCAANRIRYIAHFSQDRGRTLQSLLLTGQARTSLSGGAVVSLVNAANRYAFVDAKRLGIASLGDLFSAGDELFDCLEGIRREASALLGSPSTVFPKICCVGAFDGVLAARAISVPRFHPTLALTGLIALGAAAAIPDTIVNECVRATGGDLTRFKVSTANGTARVRSILRGSGPDALIESISVPNKRVWLGRRSALRVDARAV